ncbi:Uma2 family endonuclease [Oscillatoria sp. FACHB-1407]|uniref:Uma2 family endonuclease n=1 Tax=Oscillatoria sp. FACHB-1407 TaxID=2692847 RepID=UPI0016835C42|nr:Uma2 family endonuclease [Oscillatoria sp. FACHB-1407]MBD2459611.1 Uma2 family endonuclease [Oscillatoria sp. FACHB-1407]
MYAVISRDKTELPPGTLVRMPATWNDYCILRDSRGDGSIPRIKYRNGEVLLMSPLPRHGCEAHLLARIVETLLDSKARNYEAFTPITMDIPEERGIEPDYCFYIDNWQAVVGRDRIDWQVDPPPDLAIEIDVTTYTAAEDYAPYNVPEVWLFKDGELKIYSLQEASYQQQSLSRYFPETNLSTLINQVFQVASQQGTGIAIRELRRQLAGEPD